ncbi:MAG: flavin reductase family protein [Candidatus Bathyarchaeota archaeon]|nr:flavin reductase family protein [Candidatus Bathyarchaeota archaeon]
MVEVSYSEAMGRRFPEIVVLVISCDSEGKPDVMPAGWSMLTSGKPPMVAVSIGHTRYTHELIEETGEFVLAFPNEEMKEFVRYAGSCSGRDIDKFADSGVETLKSKCVKPPLLKDAVACFECKVREKLVTGDHTIFAGEVLASHVSEKYKERLYNLGQRRFKTIREIKEACDNKD